MGRKRRVLASATTSLALVVVLGSCAGEVGGDTTAPPATEEPAVQPIEDGEHFAYVTVGRDQSDQVTLGVDLARLLTGEEAQQAAVDEGFIEEGQELDTDFYISNPEQVMELVHVAPDAEITVISGTDSSLQVVVDTETLEMLYEGSYTGNPVYGIVAGQPIAMDIVIDDGVVSEAHAIYLP